MIIGSHDTDKRAFIIAEIGNNHEGCFQTAREMIHRAAEAGVDAVKFQTIIPERLVHAADADRLAVLRRFSFTREQFAQLSQVAQNDGLYFMSTPFDVECAEFLNSLVQVFKIASGDNTFYPLLEKVASLGKPIILSTGLAGLSDLHKSIQCIRDARRGLEVEDNLALLHCVCSYPTPANEAGLGAIARLGREFGGTVGYSDHTLGIEAAVLSIAAGARIVEKHFTLDKTKAFRDHQLSADVKDIRMLVNRIREAEEMMATPKEWVMPCERPAADAVRRSLASSRPLGKGHRVEREDITWLRPGSGIAPGNESEIIGRTLLVDMAGGTLFKPEMLG